jgi:hypothetical protein
MAPTQSIRIVLWTSARIERSSVGSAPKGGAGLTRRNTAMSVTPPMGRLICIHRLEVSTVSDTRIQEMTHVKAPAPSCVIRESSERNKSAQRHPLFLPVKTTSSPANERTNNSRSDKKINRHIKVERMREMPNAHSKYSPKHPPQSRTILQKSDLCQALHNRNIYSSRSEAGYSTAADQRVGGFCRAADGGADFEYHDGTKECVLGRIDTNDLAPWKQASSYK